MFGLSTIKAAIYGGVALAIAAGVIWTAKTIRDDGARAEREAIIIQNRSAGDVGENRRLDYHDCRARGMRFEFDSGKCRP